MNSDKSMNFCEKYDIRTKSMNFCEKYGILRKV